jgi:hypothetical protein
VVARVVVDDLILRRDRQVAKGLVEILEQLPDPLFFHLEGPTRAIEVRGSTSMVRLTSPRI